MTNQGYTSSPSHWNTVTLKDIAVRIREKNQGRTDNVLTISAKRGLVSQTEFFNKSVASKNLDGYIYLRKGDFAYNKSYSDGYPYGAIKRLEKYEEGIVSTLYLCFRPKQGVVDSDFLKFFFDSNLWHDEIRSIAQEGGRSHGLLNVSVDEFFDISLTIPPFPEQRKIAAILTSVDDAIAATQRIIEQTERVKRGLMQQLLTRGIGHTKFKQTEIGEIPVEWEVKTIDEIGRVVTGSTPKTSVAEYWGGQYPFVSPIDIGDDVYVTRTQKTVTEAGFKQGRPIPKESVLVTCIASIGKIALSSSECITNQQINAIVPYASFNPKFIYYSMLNAVPRLQELYGITAVPIINKSTFGRFSIAIPPTGEQQKIADILYAIDERLMEERAYLVKLHTLKLSLMHVLLTGKIRVKVDEEAEAVV
ncbi:MAG: restriction endonuclease subunit S [Alicyclobacillus sp.]|nr:restriction endonuclease subunit S [Alicyclobacillus sp.]